MQQRSWWIRHLGCVIASGVALLFVCILGFVLGVGALIFGAMGKSEPARLAVVRAEANEQVQMQVGRPLKVGWFVGGEISVSGPAGHAELSIPVSGPKGKGTIYLAAEKTLGRWKFSALEFAPEQGEQRINLLGAGDTLPAPQSY